MSEATQQPNSAMSCANASVARQNIAPTAPSAPIPLELLAPAQGPEQLAMALHFGADSVYLAAPRWGMRAGARNFSLDELGQAVAQAHAAGATVHLTLNTVMTDADTDELPAFLQQVDALGVDAAIVADLGAMALVRRHAPHMALHVSTQASVMSAAAATEYARLGARRIVLAREMTLQQIAELRKRLSREVELEVFAHGSMCMAYSGRCLLSAELMGPARSASHGACAQPCRWGWSLVEERSPEHPVPLETDDQASYLLSSNDLCLLGHLEALADAGADAIKIEGRNKGSYYTACVVNAYRHVLDGEPAAAWRAELDAVSHRPYSTGFLLGEPTQNPGREEYARERTMVAVVRRSEPLERGSEVAMQGNEAATQGSEALEPDRLAHVDRRGEPASASGEATAAESAIVAAPSVSEASGSGSAKPGGSTADSKTADAGDVASVWLVELTCRNRADTTSDLQVLSPYQLVRTLRLDHLELLDGDTWRPAEALVRNGATYRFRSSCPLSPLDLLCR